jgi:hypothetical protein
LPKDCDTNDTNAIVNVCTQGFNQYFQDLQGTSCGSNTISQADIPALCAQVASGSFAGQSFSHDCLCGISAVFACAQGKKWQCTTTNTQYGTDTTENVPGCEAEFQATNNACSSSSSQTNDGGVDYDAHPPPVDATVDASAPDVSTCTGGGDPDFSNVVLLMHFDGVSGSKQFIDQKGHSVTSAGTATLTGVQSMFGGASLSLANPGVQAAYLSSPSSPDWDLSSGDSTVEAWIMPTNTPTQNLALLSQSPAQGTGQWIIHIANGWSLDVQDNGGSNDVSTSGGITTGVWQHVAIVSSSGQTLLFINGQLQAQGFSNFYNVQSVPLYIGAANLDTYPGGDYGWNGYIDELRITKGVARYTSSFAPPSQAFPDCP